MMDVIFSKEIIKELAENLIMFYFTNNYSNEPSKIKHVKKSMKDYSIILENKILGSTISGYTQGDKVFLCVPNGTITEENVAMVLESLIHELFHRISKTSFDKKSIFLEEGYVSYFTSLVIDYAKNSSNISEPLRNILNRVQTINAYQTESSFVRSTQLIFDHYGIDGKMEYLFSSNGVDILKRKARLINKEYAFLFDNAKNKPVGLSSYLLPYEVNVLKRELEKVPLSNITLVELEMNYLLVDFLASRKEDITAMNPILLNSNPLKCKMKNNEDVEKFREDSSSLPFDIFNVSYDFSLSLEEKASIWGRLLANANELKTFSLGISSCSNVTIDYIAIIFAQDILKSNNDKDIKEVILSYCKVLGFDKYPDIIETLNYKVKYYISELEKSNESLDEFIEKTLLQLLNYNLKLSNIKNDDLTSSNCFDKVKDVITIGKELKDSYHTETSYSLFYHLPSLTFCYFKKKPFDKKEYDNYLKELESVNKEFMLPSSLVGNSMDSIAFRAIIKNISSTNVNKKFSLDDYFNWFDTVNPDLGKYRDDKDYLLFASILYDKFNSLLKNPKVSVDEKLEVIASFIRSDYKDNKYNSKFDYLHAVSNTSTRYIVKNTFIEQMVNEAISYLLEVSCSNKESVLSLLDKYKEVSLYLFNNSKFLNKIVEEEKVIEKKDNTIVSSCLIENKLFNTSLFSEKVELTVKNIKKDTITYNLFIAHFLDESLKMLEFNRIEFFDRYSLFCNLGLEKEACVLKNRFLEKITLENISFKEEEIIPCLEFLFLDLSKYGENSILIKNKELVSRVFTSVDELLSLYEKTNARSSLLRLRNILEKINFLSSMYENGERQEKYQK